MAYSKNISLRNKRKSIKTLLEKVSKVPEHRTGLAFHSIILEIIHLLQKTF